MNYTQSISGCLDNKIGHQGLSDNTLNLWLNRCWSEVKKLQNQFENNSLPLLRVPFETADIETARVALEKLKKGADNIVFFGTGGSSLGGQTLAHFTRWYIPGENQEYIPGSPKIRFFANLDPDTLQNTFARMKLAKTRFVIISKSGTTSETMLQAVTAIQSVRDAGLEKEIPDLFLGLTEPHKENHRNGLRLLCEKYKIPLLDHEVEVGGRYSVLTNVGLLPAILRGMDVEKLRAGAKKVVEQLLAAKSVEEYAPAVGASVIVGLTLERNIHNVVLMPYSDQLGRFPHWFVQLWAESLGKDGKGATPIAAQGPVDQHSQLQLYMDGKPHMLTLIRRDCAGEGPRAEAELANLAGIPCLSGRTVGDLVYAEQNAIYDALLEAGRPIRTIDVPPLDEEVLGALFMHFMIETILTGGLLGVDPFNQPAVEKGKTITREYLGKM